MIEVELVIELVEPKQHRRRRAERTARLPGVPSVGDSVRVARMLSMTVQHVSWDPGKGTAMLFLRPSDTSGRDSAKVHGDEVELASYHLDDMAQTGWHFGDYE